jgi:hypothetical protein
MNNEVESISEEEDVTQFKILSQHLPGGTDKNHKNLSQDSCPETKI